MPHPSVSLQLYTLRHAMATDLAGTLQRVADIGFVNVEPYAFTDRPEEYRSALAATGLSAPSGHAPLLAMSEPRAALEAARSLGMSVVVDPYTEPERWSSREEIVRIADGLGSLADLAEEVGMEVGYHNHAWEFSSQIGGAAAFDFFVAALDSRVVLEIDTYWVEVGGGSATEVLTRFGDRVRLIHVKDGPISPDTDQQVGVGEGAMDVPGILAAAPTAIRVIELDSYAGDVFEPVERSLRYLKAQS